MRHSQQWTQRQRLFEPLEPRIVLNAAPIAKDDAWYFTAEDTALTVTTSEMTLLDNDWDPEGDSLTASVVDSPANGSVSNFSGSDGTFTYTPDTSYVGFDSFTYKVNDGTDDSNIVTVSIAVGGNFGPRTNLDERARDAQLLTGELQLAQSLTPGFALIYDSSTLPRPIIVLETFLQDSSCVPDEITAQLTFNSTAGTAYTYDTTSLSSGDALRFALQADATALATGRYDYSVKLTADITSTLVDHTYSGSYDVVNRGGSAHPFGRGWQLAGLDELVIDTSGVLWVQADGDALWFEEDGSGGYDAAEGDQMFSTLVENVNVDDTFTLTDKHGIEAHFSATGVLTSREDRNGNTLTYTYTSGLLTKITDHVNRDTTFTYTSGQLTSVSDFASRTATLTYDASGRLTKITQPDPDGAGSLAAPETEFAYDATSHQLTQVTNPLDDVTQFEYGTHDRLKKRTHADNNTWQLTALQTIGLPTGTTGNALTAADPTGSVTNERSKTSTFRTDRFGNLTESTNPLGYQTEIERNQHGQTAKLIEADPDGAQTTYASPITIFGLDTNGNVVYRRSPRGYSRTWTYTTTFNQVASATDELSRTVDYTYDSSGNRTKFTDGDDFEWTYTFDTSGRVTNETAPDPDGAGSLTAPENSFSYDTYGRLDTITNPDATTASFDYDSADNLTKITDERAKETTFAYDTLNRLTSTTDRESATRSYKYDAIGQRTTETDALSDDTVYEYNSRGWVTKITQPDPDDTGSLTAPETTYTYDATGNITDFGGIDFMGSGGLWYSYDDAGRRVEQNGPGVLGQSVTEYAYDNLGRLTKVTDPLDTETRYKYDSSGNLIHVMHVQSTLMPPDDVGPATQYAYNADERLAHVTDERGYTTDYTHNARGLLERTTLPDRDGSGPQGHFYTLNTYDNMGRLIEVTDPLQRKMSYEYDSRNRVTKLTDLDPDYGGALAAPVTTYAYDAAGRMTSVTDPLSRVTSFLHDDEGRVTKLTAPDPDGAGALTSPVTDYGYNVLGKVTSVTDPLGGVTSNEYDTLQRVTKITQPDPDGAGSLTAPVTTYVYNAQGKIDTITDPLGRDTTFGYDNQGRRTGVTDDSGNTTSYTYNVLNQVTQIALSDPDDTGSLTAPVTSYVYDGYHRLYSMTDPEGGVTAFSYDDAGNLLTLRDSVNNTTTFAYDGLGNLTIETNALGDARSFYYDASGRLTRRVDRNEQILQFAYDELHRKTSEKWFENATPVPTITIATTTEGGLTDEVQRVGFSDDIWMLYGGTFTLTFDNQTTSSIAWNADAATLRSALEALSNVEAGEVSVQKTQADGGTQEWQITFTSGLAGANVAQTTVDTSNVLRAGTITEIEATDTSGGTTNDEVQTVTLANADDGTFRLAFQGQTAATLAYDATAAQVETVLEDLNAVDNVTVTGSAGGPWTVTFIGTHLGIDQPQMNGDAAALTSGTEIREITYTYDVASQLTGVSDPDSTYAYTYDNLGRVLTVDNDGTTGVANVILTSAYDANSNRTSLSAVIDSTDDFLNSYTYDTLNRLTQVGQVQPAAGNTVAEKRVDFAYNAIGHFTTIARFNDLDGTSGDEVATSTYSYDTLGRLTGLAYKNGGTNLFTPYEWSYDNLRRITQFVSADGTSDYSYDKTSQLTGADHNYQTDEAYTYDANGNRTMTGYTTGTNNQLTNDGTYSYTYDDEGNRLTRTNGTTDEVTEYEWDFRNRLTKVTEKPLHPGRRRHRAIRLR
ncbi:MAG: cadherin-like domain-containing protein [Planctomycetia bacterium]|nr:cadherin-like domain-containing protein [Planctomycetia bacterium]